MAVETFVEPVSNAQCSHCGAAIDVTQAKPLTDITCPVCGKPTTVPGMLDHYQLVKVLGQGSAGVVYQGFDTQNQFDVAVKVFLKKKGEASSKHIEKCLAEATAMRSFNHPNIVKIYRVAQKAERPFIVMELLTGEQLDKMIENHWLVEEPRAIKLGLDVAEGLKAVHDAGFAHLDVKPGNMQLDGQGTCKLLDYDTARSLNDIESQGAGLVGTPYYVAPEVIQREQVDFRADIYSLGATLFHLLAQRPPFQGATSRDVVQERLKRRAVTLKEVRPDVSNETSLAIARMLEPQPRDRYGDYDTLLADLRRALNAAQWDAQLKAGGSAKTNQAKSSLPAVITGVILATVIGFGVWFGTRGNSADDTNTPPSTDGTVRPSTMDQFASRDSTRVSTKDRAATKDTPASQKDSASQPVKKDSNPTKTKDSVIKPPPVKIDTKLIPPIKPDVPIVKILPAKWTAGKDVEIVEENGKLSVFCVGKTPYIRCPRVEGPNRQTSPDDTAALLIRLRASGEGEGRLYWNTPTEPLWDKARSQVFLIKHNNEWREHVIPIRTDAKQLEIRVDVGEGPGIVEIDHIRYYLNIVKDRKPTAEWLFDGDDAKVEKQIEK